MEKYIPKSAVKEPVRFLAVSAHKDDTEMFAFDGIVRSSRGEGGFAAVVLTDGGACPRSADYAGVTDEDMAEIRTAEQKRAAEAGRYSALYLFEESSARIKQRPADLTEALADILRSYSQVETLYIHSPFDRHPTHVASCLLAIDAVRMLKNEEKPRKIYGCELWRDLDWLPADKKVVFDVEGFEDLAARLMSSFDSQNAVKRYDIAALARRRANATFYESHEGDEAEALIYAVDLTALANGASTKTFVQSVIDQFRGEVLKNLGEN